MCGSEDIGFVINTSIPFCAKNLPSDAPDSFSNVGLLTSYDRDHRDNPRDRRIKQGV